MNLTQKEENFCLKYVECGNGSEAYRHAYNAEKMQNNSVHVNAFKILARIKVSLRLRILREEAQERMNVTVKEKKEWLRNVIERSLGKCEPILDSKGRGLTAIRAINELNRMDGHHAPIQAKVDIGLTYNL